MEKKIIECSIKEDGYKNIISVVYDDKTMDDKIGAYYPDELHYSENEFIGLTKEQAVDLIRKKDIAYLRS